MASVATIGMLRESSLHASLKALYARPGDELEAIREGYVVDLVRPDELVEFQTGNFASLRPKLTALLEHHRVRVVHPVAVERTIVRIDRDGVVRESSSLARARLPPVAVRRARVAAGARRAPRR